MKNKTSKIQKKKLTLKEFVWFGFNTTASIGFVSAFAVTANPNPKSNPIGMHSLWVLLLLGLIAAVCAWSFAKMARVHNSNNNGGAYIYTRTTLGKFYGFMITFLQYVGMPFIITIQILFLFQGVFTTNFSGVSQVAAHWGPFTNLWLDLIGVFIYIGCACLIYLGVKAFKNTNQIAALLKWITSAVLLIAALYFAFNAGSSNLSFWTTSTKHGGGNQLSLTGVLYSFNTFFFFFAGFETFSTAGRNIENPERNIGLGIIIIIAICTAFYVLIGFIFFTGYQNFYQNMSLGSWKGIKVKWIFYGGVITMIASQFFMKVQASVQNALYGGTLLQPLAKEGFISDKYRKLNKDNLPIRAITLNLIITIAVIMIWLIIPDIISGIMTLNGKGIGGAKDYTSYHIKGYNIATFSAMSSVITIFIYASVILVNLILATQNKLRMNIFEWIVFILTFIFLLFIFGFHYYYLIDHCLLTKDPKYIAFGIEVAFTVISIASGLLIYFVYYLPKYKARLVAKPDIQKRLEKEFEVIDDWAYVSLELEREVKNYLKRNLALHANTTNKNYKLASEIDKELKKVIEEYNNIIEERKKHDNEHVDE